MAWNSCRYQGYQKRGVFSLDLNVVIMVAQRTSTDNLFHSLGAADRNALEPILEVTRGSPKKRESKMVSEVTRLSRI